MKKLLFASIIMMGFSAVAAAQTSEAKKAELKKQASQPSFSTAAGETTTKPSAVAADKAKAEKEVNAEKTVATEPKVVEVKKAEKPAAKRVKQN